MCRAEKAESPEAFSIVIQCAEASQWGPPHGSFSVSAPGLSTQQDVCSAMTRHLISCWVIHLWVTDVSLEGSVQSYLKGMTNELRIACAL